MCTCIYIYIKLRQASSASGFSTDTVLQQELRKLPVARRLNSSFLASIPEGQLLQPPFLQALPLLSAFGCNAPFF